VALLVREQTLIVQAFAKVRSDPTLTVPSTSAGWMRISELDASMS
jgi:hypothetical protein